MRRIRKNKYINYILVLLICLSIGYAVLESNLSINGTTNISTVNWDVHFENLIVADSSMPTENPATILSDRTTIEYGINFTSLDQYYLFYVDIVNTGDYDAMLDSISTTVNNVSIDNLPDYIDYTII